VEGWIKSDVDLRWNPKLGDLADILQVRPVPLMGHLTAFWHWSWKYFNSGVIYGRNLENKIAVDGADWQGDAVTFVNALVETRLLHRSEDAPRVCEKCFPPAASGAAHPPLQPGGFVIHDWDEITYHYRLFQERKQIKRAQDAERQRRRRAAPDERPTVREPSPPYAKRGLRKAPSLVKAALRHALESVTVPPSHADKSVTDPSCHANERVTEGVCHANPSVTSRDEMRDVTLLSQNDRSAKSDVLAMGDERLSEVSRRNIADNVKHSVSRSETRDVTQESPERKRASFKDQTASSSLPNNGSEEEAGTNDVPAAFSDSTHQGCIGLWLEEFRKATGESYARDAGYIARGVAKLARLGYSHDQIATRIKNFFASTWDGVRKEKWSFALFSRRFNELEAGPLIPFGSGAEGRVYAGAGAGEDLRKFNPKRDAARFTPDN
jgi:hypothetical protein